MSNKDYETAKELLTKILKCIDAGNKTAGPLAEIAGYLQWERDKERARAAKICADYADECTQKIEQTDIDAWKIQLADESRVATRLASAIRRGEE